MKILLSDDSDVVRRLLKTYFSDLPQAYVEGKPEDHHQVIEYTQTLVPDVIILNFEMPGMNGLKILKAIKQLPTLLWSAC